MRIVERIVSVYRNHPVQKPQPTSAIAQIVAAREHRGYLRERQVRSAELRARDAAIAKHARRPARVSVEPGRITIAPQAIADGMRAQLPWGILFNGFMFGTFVWPGLAILLYVVGVPLGWAFLASAAIWTAILLGANYLYVRATSPAWILDVTHDACFALHNGDPERATLAGRTSQLRVSMSNPDPSSLHGVDFVHAKETVEVRDLTDRDIRALQAALASHVRLD